MSRNAALLGLGVAAATVAGGALLGGRRQVRRLAATHLPEGDDLYVPPDDVTHHHLRSHDGGTIHVAERGSGRPLVLLHGVTLRWDVWSPQLHGLTDRYRVLAVDLRGHGQSEPGSNGYGLDQLGHDLATLLETMDLGDAIVVGHSMGGMTAMHFCADHPSVLAERVAGLAFVATAAPMVLPAPMAALLTRPGQRLVHRLESGKRFPYYRFGQNPASLLMVRSAFGKDPSGAAVEQVRSMLEAMPQMASVPSVVGLLDHDVRESLAAVGVPSMAIVGTRDTLTPPWCSRLIAGTLPGCQLQVLAGCGHQVMQERPTELALLIDQLAASTESRGEPTIDALAG